MKKQKSEEKLLSWLVTNTPWSRRQLETLIKDGKVSVNGNVVTAFSMVCNTGKDVIKVNNKRIQTQKKIYYKYHKPYNMISTLDDPKGRATLKDALKKARLPETLFPIGRLDRYTTGLLLFTNDGNWANSIIHPSFEIEKVYKVTTAEPLTKNNLKTLIEGIELEDGPAKCTEIEKIGPRSILVSIHEGRNRIVRRLFEAIGHDVKKLHRLSIGQIQLGKLPKGKFKPLTMSEVKRFK